MLLLWLNRPHDQAVYDEAQTGKEEGESTGKRRRPVNMEALAGMLKEASYVPEYAPIEETLFDMDNPGNRFLSDAQGLDLHSDRMVLEAAYLNTLGDGLMKFNRLIGFSPVEMLPVQSLLDSGASRVFVGKKMIERLPATLVICRHGHMHIRLPNGECLTSDGCIQLLLHLGAWTGVI